MTKHENFMLAQRCIDNIQACSEEVEDDELRETILNLTAILRKRVIDIYYAESQRRCLEFFSWEVRQNKNV